MGQGYKPIRLRPPHDGAAKVELRSRNGVCYHCARSRSGANRGANHAVKTSVKTRAKTWGSSYSAHTPRSCDARQPRSALFMRVSGSLVSHAKGSLRAPTSLSPPRPPACVTCCCAGLLVYTCLALAVRTSVDAVVPALQPCFDSALSARIHRALGLRSPWVGWRPRCCRSLAPAVAPQGDQRRACRRRAGRSPWPESAAWG